MDIPMTYEDQQVQALRALSAEIPLNDFGLPIGVYRTDLLPFQDYNGEASPPTVLPKAVEDPSQPSLPQTASSVESEAERAVLPESGTDLTARSDRRIAGFRASDLNAAFMPLQYDEGFPALRDGSPFWSRMDFEPADAFLAFEHYLHMSRGTDSDLDDDEPGEAASGERGLARLAARLFPDANGTLSSKVALLQRYYHLYYWNQRAHAYDLFKVAQHRKQQELRAIETGDEHYTLARRLRHKLAQYMESEDEFWDMMTPKTAIDLLKQTTQMERISAGLPAMGPAHERKDGEDHAGRPLSVTLRTVAQNNHTGRGGNTLNEDGDVLEAALESPETVELLQELIIKGT